MRWSSDPVSNLNGVGKKTTKGLCIRDDNINIVTVVFVGELVWSYIWSDATRPVRFTRTASESEILRRD